MKQSTLIWARNLTEGTKLRWRTQRATFIIINGDMLEARLGGRLEAILHINLLDYNCWIL